MLLPNIKNRFCLSDAWSPHVLFIHLWQRVGLQEQVRGRQDGGRVVISNRGFNLQLRPHDIRQPLWSFVECSLFFLKKPKCLVGFENLLLQQWDLSTCLSCLMKLFSSRWTHEMVEANVGCAIVYDCSCVAERRSRGDGARLGQQWRKSAATLIGAEGHWQVHLHICSDTTADLWWRISSSPGGIRTCTRCLFVTLCNSHK